MADIAAHLGVSRQLVSIVLRDQPGASDENRERVRRAARELGYSPHMAAQTLRQSRSRHIGVAFSPAHGTEPDIVEAIYPAAADLGFHVVLSAETRTRTTFRAVEELLEYRCAAVILLGPELSARELSGLAARTAVPLVAVGAARRARSYDVVRSAGDHGIARLVEHLVQLGHREIAYVHAPAMPAAEVRLQGYVSTLTAHDLQLDVMDIPGPEYTEEAGAAAGRELVAREHLPTAVATGNDQQGIGVLQVLTRAGVSIPGDVSLTGFDDTRFAGLTSIDMSTARQDPEEMGIAAVRAAVRRIDDPAARPLLSIVEPTLVIRSSTGPPPAGPPRAEFR